MSTGTLHLILYPVGGGCIGQVGSGSCGNQNQPGNPPVPGNNGGNTVPPDPYQGNTDPQQLQLHNPNQDTSGVTGPTQNCNDCQPLGSSVPLQSPCLGENCPTVDINCFLTSNADCAPSIAEVLARQGTGGGPSIAEILADTPPISLAKAVADAQGQTPKTPINQVVVGIAPPIPLPQTPAPQLPGAGNGGCLDPNTPCQGK